MDAQLERLLTECRQALMDGVPIQALQQLSDHLHTADRGLQNEILLHLSRMSRIRDQERKGLLTGAESQTQRNRVSLAILELLDIIPETLRRTSGRSHSVAAPPSIPQVQASAGQVEENPKQGLCDIFLSHNSLDKPLVRHLAQALTQRGLHVWMDETDLPAGRPWQPELDRILGQVRTIAILVGPSGQGPWEIHETWVSLDEAAHRGITVLPVLLPGLVQRPELSRFLRQYTWVDMSAGFSEEAIERIARAALGASSLGVEGTK